LLQLLPHEKGCALCAAPEAAALFADDVTSGLRQIFSALQRGILAVSALKHAVFRRSGVPFRRLFGANSARRDIFRRWFGAEKLCTPKQW